MELVIDANILFAALIRKNITSELLLHDDFHFYAPEYLIEEFKKHRTSIKEKTDIEDHVFEDLLSVYQQRIQLIPQDEIKPFIQMAKHISPDIDDVAYFALALKLHIPIWSNDKDLKEKQSTITVYSTRELLDLFL